MTLRFFLSHSPCFRYLDGTIRFYVCLFFRVPRRLLW